MTEFTQSDGGAPSAEWLKLILPVMREGYMLKICPNGTSMAPFLAGGRDEAVLALLTDDFTLKKNDVVLYRIKNGIHVLHRICRINKNGIYTLGDFQSKREGPFHRNEIIAVADHIIRKGKKINRGDRFYLVLITVWRWLGPFKRHVAGGYFMLKRLLKSKNNGDF